MTTEIPISSDLYYSIVLDTPFYQLASPNCYWFCSGVRFSRFNFEFPHVSACLYCVCSFPIAFLFLVRTSHAFALCITDKGS